MKGDFSRNTFDPSKHYTVVLHQQGRVQLDADLNENSSILIYYLRTLTEDIIGEHGGPAGNVGFDIKPRSGRVSDFIVGKGHYYVNGILCEQNSDSLVTFLHQPDYSVPPVD